MEPVMVNICYTIVTIWHNSFPSHQVDMMVPGYFVVV